MASGSDNSQRFPRAEQRRLEPEASRPTDSSENRNYSAERTVKCLEPSVNVYVQHLWLHKLEASSGQDCTRDKSTVKRLLVETMCFSHQPHCLTGLANPNHPPSGICLPLKPTQRQKCGRQHLRKAPDMLTVSCSTCGAAPQIGHILPVWFLVVRSPCFPVAAD